MPSPVVLRASRPPQTPAVSKKSRASRPPAGSGFGVLVLIVCLSPGTGAWACYLYSVVMEEDSVATTEHVLHRLSALVETAAAGVGSARARQLRWVRGELALFHDSRPRGSLAALLSPEHLAEYLHAADAGMLRTRGAVGTPSPPGASRARRVCLQILLDAHGAESAPLPPAEASTPRPRIAHRAAQRVMAVLTAHAREPGARAGTVRAAFVAALVHHHDLRTGEIAALRLADLDRDAQGVTMRVLRSAPGAGPTEIVHVALAPACVELLDLWLLQRERLVERGATAHDTLLVSVRANHRDGAHLPPGSPLEERGLLRSHVAAIGQLNNILLDSPSTAAERAPLPRTLNELRPQESGDQPH